MLEKGKKRSGKFFLICLIVLTVMSFALSGCSREPKNQTPTGYPTGFPGDEQQQVIEDEGKKEPMQTHADEKGNENKSEPEYTARRITEKQAQAAADIETCDTAFLDGTKRFSMELFQKCVAQNQGNNIMLSPLSAQSALAIAANGAAGTNLAELKKVLCSSEKAPEGMELSELNRNLRCYMQSLQSTESVKLQYGNSIWIRDDAERIRVKEDFLSRISVFDADAFLASFDNTTLEDMNGWVDFQTFGMIPSVLNEISDSAVMYILNAIAFDGKWETPFLAEDILEEFTFTRADGETQTVTAMHQELSTYLEDAHAAGFLKYYKNDAGKKYAFMALLPKEGMTPEEYIAGLTWEGFDDILNAVQNIPVSITMPKFKSEYSQELNLALQQMGMVDAFLDGADFSELAKTQTGILKVDRVFQKTFIEVDEEGTKAAAVTVVEMTDGCAPVCEEQKLVVLDRPFVYAIVDMDTGLPVFIGVLNSVDE